MDDILLNVLLTQMSRQIIAQRLLYNEITSCNICHKIVPNISLKKCVFCEKAFCIGCCGKEGTNICEQCNFGLAMAVNFKVLNQFSVKELRVISNNYNIPLQGILEKKDLIEALLKNFKKSIQGCDQPIVDVEYLKTKISEMRIEEIKTKESNLKKERENAQLFTSFEKVDNPEEEVLFDFNNVKEINVSVEDIPNMPIKEIKFILDAFKIDYSFVIEKKELVNLAIKLTKSFKEFQKINPYRKEENEIKLCNEEEFTKENCEEKINFQKKGFECVICMNQPISSVFLKCAHSNCCYECAKKMNECPICRQVVENCIKIYFG